MTGRGVPHWFMEEVEYVIRSTKRRGRPFAAFYRPDRGATPVLEVPLDRLDDHAVQSPRFMGVYDPSSSGMESALSRDLIEMYRAEPRKDLGENAWRIPARR